MDWWKTNRRLAALALASVAIIWAWIAFRGPLPTLGPGEWAAWVQALGSIAAIVGAAWISDRQGREQRRRDLEAVETARRDLLTGAAELVTAGAKMLEVLAERASGPDPSDTAAALRLSACRRLEAQMTRFPAETLRPTTALRSFNTAASLFSLNLETVEAARQTSAGQSDAEIDVAFRSLAAGLSRDGAALGRISAALTELQVRKGGDAEPPL